MQIPSGVLCKAVLAWNPFSLATIGGCVFCAPAPAGALFYLRRVYGKVRIKAGRRVCRATEAACALFNDAIPLSRIGRAIIKAPIRFIHFEPDIRDFGYDQKLYEQKNIQEFEDSKSFSHYSDTAFDTRANRTFSVSKIQRFSICRWGRLLQYCVLHIYPFDPDRHFTLRNNSRQENSIPTITRTQNEQ